MVQHGNTKLKLGSPGANGSIKGRIKNRALLLTAYILYKESIFETRVAVCRMGRGRTVGRYLRPVRGCINAGCAAGAAVATAGFGLLTFVLLLANSSRMVCGMSGSKRTPCCEQPRATRRSDIVTGRSVYGCCLRHRPAGRGGCRRC